MFTINMGHLVSGATMAQPTIESAGYVKKRMAHGKYFEIHEHFPSPQLTKGGLAF
jgi:hypothetical protein